MEVAMSEWKEYKLEEIDHNNKAKILDKKVYDDELLENIKQTINFITKRIKVEFVIKSAEKKKYHNFRKKYTGKLL